MEAPNCLKCGSPSNMAEEDSGLTFQSWRCTKCNIGRSKKNWFGHALPLLSLGLMIFGLSDDGGTGDGGMGDNSGGGDS